MLRAYFAFREAAETRRWGMDAARLCRQMIDPGVHKAVVTCGPPQMTHLGGWWLSRRSGLSHIMDMRDPWSFVERLPEAVASPVWLWLGKYYEPRIVQNAGLVVANTEPSRDAMRARYPGWADRIIAVTNGYDDEPAPARESGGPFLVAYSGGIYIDRDPRPLFRAAGRVVRELNLAPGEFRVQLIGEANAFDGVGVVDLAAEVGLSAGYVEAIPHVPRRTLSNLLAQATMLVSLPQDSHLAIPSKIFQYMQFDAWLLALADPQSATARLLDGSGADVVSATNLDGLTEVLRRRVLDFRGGGRPVRLASRWGRFSRGHQAAILFEALRSCTGADGPGQEGDRSAPTPSGHIPVVHPQHLAG